MPTFILAESYKRVNTCKNCRVLFQDSSKVIGSGDVVQVVKVINPLKPARFWALDHDIIHRGFGEACEYFPIDCEEQDKVLKGVWEEQDKILDLILEARDAWLRFDLELNHPVLMSL